MDARIKPDLHLDHVRVTMEAASDELLKAAALRVVERAQSNIRANDQIDTGFMVNSAYAKWRAGSTYRQAETAAAGSNTGRDGRRVDHTGDLTDEIGLPENARAAAVVGANYAIYQEAADPFLWPAAEATAQEFGGFAQRVYRQPQEGR